MHPTTDLCEGTYKWHDVYDVIPANVLLSQDQLNNHDWFRVRAMNFVSLNFLNYFISMD